MSRLLDETGAGTHAPAVPDIKDALKELYQEFMLGGKVVYRGRKSEINNYSYREMAGKFAAILNRLADG